MVGRDAGENRAPLPTPLTSRTFAGSAVKIDVPLDQLDPDGDSVTLTGIVAPPELGRVLERTSTSITYEAFTGSAGTDELTYELRDTLGATATGTVRIGVIPRPEVQLPPKAVDDAIEIIRSRVDALGVAEPEILRQGDSIVVNLPGVADRERALEVIGRTAELRFRPVLQGAPYATAGEVSESSTTTTAPGGRIRRASATGRSS